MRHFVIADDGASKELGQCEECGELLPANAWNCGLCAACRAEAVPVVITEVLEPGDLRDSMDEVQS